MHSLCDAHSHVRAAQAVRSSAGFTLLELIVAITILASFILPLLDILSKAKIRTTIATQERQLRDFAHRKLFDRMHFYEEEDSGDFAAEGRAEWTWEILPLQLVGQGEQALLEYTIEVYTPQKLGGRSEEHASEEGSVYRFSAWTFPDPQWYDEQEQLNAMGYDSLLYGSATGAVGGGLPPLPR